MILKPTSLLENAKYRRRGDTVKEYTKAIVTGNNQGSEFHGGS